MASIPQPEHSVKSPKNASRRSERSERQAILQYSLLAIEAELTAIAPNATPRQTALIRGRLLPAISELKRSLHHSNILPQLPVGDGGDL
jgi:hypothetical protein